MEGGGGGGCLRRDPAAASAGGGPRQLHRSGVTVWAWPPHDRSPRTPLQTGPQSPDTRSRQAPSPRTHSLSSPPFTAFLSQYLLVPGYDRHCLLVPE